MPVKKNTPAKDKKERSFTKVELETSKVMSKPQARKKIKIKKKTILQKEAKEFSPVLNQADEKRIEKDLEEIYQNGDGTMPDMGDFEKNKRNHLLTAFLVLVFACVFLAVVAWAGFFMFSPQSRFNEEYLTLNITGEEQIMAGQEVRYRIHYRNAQNVPLSKVVLQVRYPEGFVFESASKTPTSDKTDEWVLGSLEEQGSGYLDIFGKLYGDLGKQQSFRVFLNYFPANFSSEFQKVSSLNTEIKDSPVSFVVTAPEEVVPGAETEFVVDIIKPDESISNLALVMETANSFTKTNSQPATDEAEEYQWSLGEMVADKEIRIKGTFSPSVDEASIQVKFKLLVWKDDDKSLEPYLLGEEVIDLVLLKTDLSANLVINGSLSDFFVQPGEILNISIDLKNAGDTPLKNVIVRLIFETPSYSELSMLDWYELEDLADGDIIGEQVNSQTRRGYITWNSKQILDLRQLDPGEELLIDLHIPFKDNQDIDLTKFTSYLTTAMVEVKYENGGGQKLLSSKQINLTVNSDFEFELRDKVIENNQNKELHTVTWFLSNSYHELQDIELSADVYGDVTWQEENLVVPAGEAKYDPTEKKLVWQVETMPTSVDVLALQFGLLLNNKNPSQSNLMSKVTIKAKDAITGEDIIMAGDEILLN